MLRDCMNLVPTTKNNTDTLNLTRRSLFILQQAIRNFFNAQNFLDVLAPPVVPNPGIEAHLHPFELYSVKDQKKQDLYLQTSPEFALKELMAQGFGNLFTLCYCFRDEPHSSTHRPQFLMLEWYRVNENYNTIADDIIQLIEFCRQKLIENKIPVKFEEPLIPKIMTVNETFQDYAGFSLFDYPKTQDLKNYTAQNFPELLPRSHNLEWEDYYFLIFLNIIEPQLKSVPLLILKEYPARMAALSTLKRDNPLVSERFEVFVHGLELANCFNELRDLAEQKKRYQREADKKERLYQYQLPQPTVLFNALEKGIPESAGIAMGVERLLLALTGFKNPFYN